MLDDETHAMCRNCCVETGAAVLRARSLIVSQTPVSRSFLMLGLSQFRRNCAAQKIALPSEPAPPDDARIFVLVPHCDDETLGCGGFISAARARGLAVQIAFTTNGDGSRSTQIAQTMRHRRVSNFLELAALRQKEARAACAELGVEESDVLFFGYPDGGTGALWNFHWHAPFRSPFTRASSVMYADAQTPGAPYCGAALLRDVRAALENFRPSLIITTHPADTHSDHWACWAFAQSALESLQLGGCDWAHATQMRAFPVHRGVWPAPHGYHPAKKLAPPADLLLPSRRWTSWDLKGDASAAKKRALAQHDSQMTWTPLYLRGFLRRNEIFETIARAEENPAQDEAARGVSLLAFDDETLKLRIKLHFGRGTMRLFLRAVGAEETRAWNIFIHPSHVKHGVARAREMTATSGEFHNWPAAPMGNGFDITVPLAALAPAGETGVSRDISLFVSASAQMRRASECEEGTEAKTAKVRTREATEIGVVRLANVQADSTPILVSRLDPRTAKVGTARVGTARVGSARVGSARKE